MLATAKYQTSLPPDGCHSVAGHYFADASKLPNGVAIGVIVLFCFFISSFAWSWGPLGWLVPSEIHPLETRSAGQGINVAVNL